MNNVLLAQNHQQVRHAEGPLEASMFTDTRVLRIVIYARLSKNRHGLSTNTAIQVAECEEEARYYAKDKGRELIVVERFEENDISASKFSDKPRPLYEAMMRLVEQNKVDMIWATEMERLARRPDQMGELIKLADTTDLHMIYFTSDEGYDLSTPNGILRARGSVDRAEFESRKLSQRVKRKAAANASEGKSNGGRRPFGYKKGGMELELSEVAWIKLMAAKVVGGWSYREVAWWLNDQGVKTAEGRPFHPKTVHDVLANKRYVGIRVHIEAEYPALWPPVFTVEEFDELQLIIHMRSEKYADRPKPRKYLFTGFLKCGLCGHSLVGQKQYDRKMPPRLTYKCHIDSNISRNGRGCRGVTINALALDEFIRQQIIKHLDDDNLAKLLSVGQDDASQLKSLLADRKAKLAHRTTLENERAEGLLAKDEFYRMRTRVVDAIARIDEQINQARQKHIQLPIKAGQSIAEAWADNPDGWRRMLTERVIKKITVNSSHAKPRFKMPDGSLVVFDTERVVIEWRELSNADLYGIAALINEGLALTV